MLTWLFRLTMVAIVAGLIGLALLWEPRLNDENRGTCGEPSASFDGDRRVTFDASCEFWPTRVSISSDTPIATFAEELTTEKDVALFGGGGPDCVRAGRAAVVCEGEVDAGESFEGWVTFAEGACRARIGLRVEGGVCSSHGGCDDIGQLADVALPRPGSCG